jgi:hypothetical protein
VVGGENDECMLETHGFIDVTEQVGESAIELADDILVLEARRAEEMIDGVDR